MEQFKDYVLLDDKILVHDEESYLKEIPTIRRAFSDYRDAGRKDSFMLPYTSVKDQGSIGSCTAFAAVAALETLVLVDKCVRDDLSETFCYSMNKLNDEWNGVWYSGSSVTAASRVIKNVGICHEELCPYVLKEYVHPTEDMMLDASARTAWPEAIEFSEQAFIYFLSKGFPIMLAFKMFSNFYEPKEGYIRDLGRVRTGGHAVMCFGYEYVEDTCYFLIKNSWGLNYASDGIVKISASVLFQVIKSAYYLSRLNVNYKEGPINIDPIPYKPKSKPWYKRLWRWLTANFYIRVENI